jgi:hypothetical protein
MERNTILLNDISMNDIVLNDIVLNYKYNKNIKGVKRWLEEKL